MSLEADQIIATLDKLSITRAQEPTGQNWISVLCPYHDDRNLGSAYISLDTSIFYCQSCKTSSNLYSIVKYLTGFSNPKEIFEYMGQTGNAYYDEALNDKKKSTKPIETINEENKKSIKRKFIPHTTLIDPGNYHYTRKRGITLEFINKYQITKCEFGFYKDFMIIPVIDQRQGIETYEARKLMEHEYLIKFFKEDAGFKRLQRAFKLYAEKNKLSLNYIKKESRYILFKNGREFNDPIQFYLMMPKVLYPSGVNVNNTIFNIDNLDFEKDVYIREGITGLGKIYIRFKDNITSLFGSNVSENQIEILRQFKGKKIIIPDNDNAGDDMVEKLYQELPGVWVIPVESEDTDNSFANELDNNIIEGPRYIKQKHGPRCYYS